MKMDFLKDSKHLFIYLVLILQLSSQKSECKPTNKTASHKSTNDDHENGESRVSGGIFEKNVPGFLGTAWAQATPDKYRDTYLEGAPGETNPDGRFVGHLIGLGKNHLLMHEKTAKALETPPNSSWGSYVPEDLVPLAHIALPYTNNTISARYAFPTPNKFNTDHFEPNPGTELQQVDTFHGFGLYKAESDLDKDGHDTPTFEAPVLEHNKNEFGSDCRGYGWSDDPDVGSRGGKDRQFVEFPVRVDKRQCEGGDCVLSFGGLTPKLNFCRGLGDLGMPILCGKEKRLTYLINKDTEHVERDKCNNQRVRAFHVPHMIEKISDAMALGR